MKRELILLSGAALVLAACGGDDEAIEISNAWARTSPAAVTTGATYLDVTAADDDVLVAVSVASSVAGEAQIHEVVPAEMEMDDESMGDMDDDSMNMGDDESMDEMAMVMQELTDGLPLPAGETVSFEPGGSHIMLLDLVEPLETGDEFEVTLDFENAADLTLTVTVAETAPDS